MSPTRTLSHSDMKHSAPRRIAKVNALHSEKPNKQQKPTKWGEQLLVKMEALRKALAAQA